MIRLAEGLLLRTSTTRQEKIRCWHRRYERCGCGHIASRAGLVLAILRNEGRQAATADGVEAGEEVRCLLNVRADTAPQIKCLHGHALLAGRRVLRHCCHHDRKRARDEI